MELLEKTMERVELNLEEERKGEEKGKEEEAADITKEEITKMKEFVKVENGKSSKKRSN